jgi:hypothetical protein
VECCRGLQSQGGSLKRRAGSDPAGP